MRFAICHKRYATCSSVPRQKFKACRNGVWFLGFYAEGNSDLLAGFQDDVAEVVCDFLAVDIDSEAFFAVVLIAAQLSIREKHAPNIKKLSQGESFNRRRFDMDQSVVFVSVQGRDERVKIPDPDFGRQSIVFTTDKKFQVLVRMDASAFNRQSGQTDHFQPFKQTSCFRRPRMGAGLNTGQSRRIKRRFCRFLIGKLER